MMTSFKQAKESGNATGWLIAVIGLAVLSAGAIAAAVWGIINYNDQKTNVDEKINTAVITAKKDQADSDEIKFAQREKEPNRQFVGPDDYGRLTFDYPKTWSVYVSQDASMGGTFAAYLNPVSVPAVSDTQQYSLRVTIATQSYESVIAGYSALVKKGDLQSSAVSVDGNNGTRLDGSFSKDIRGAAVIYKIRDKTVILRTDADTFLPDFNALIATIKFNQ